VIRWSEHESIGASGIVSLLMASDGCYARVAGGEIMSEESEFGTLIRVLHPEKAKIRFGEINPEAEPAGSEAITCNFDNFEYEVDDHPGELIFRGQVHYLRRCVRIRYRWPIKDGIWATDYLFVGYRGDDPVEVSRDVTIGGVRVGDVIGGKWIEDIAGESGAIIDDKKPSHRANTDIQITPRERLSGEQALSRIADAVRLNLDQLQRNMDQARRESSQFFRTMLAFSAFASVIILSGIGLMLSGLITPGVVTTAASFVPQAGALLFFKKDKELRGTIQSYHGHLLQAQRVLTMVDLAETIDDPAAKNSAKEKIIVSGLQIDTSKRPSTPAGAEPDNTTVS
jgi:hypothetical protein